jgi:hypothetical protein
MSSFGLIKENMVLSHIHLAVKLNKIRGHLYIKYISKDIGLGGWQLVGGSKKPQNSIT